MNRAVLLFAASVVLALHLSPSALRAQSPEETARTQYQEGIRLFDSGNYSEAALAFRDAYRAKPSWRLHFNIGQAEAAANRLGLALDAFEAYMVQGADQVPDDKKDMVLGEIQRLRQLVGVLELRAPEGSELLIDDVSRGVTPFEGVIRVEAGQRRIVVRREGIVLRDVTLRISSGVTTRIDAIDKEEPPVSMAADTEKDSASSVSAQSSRADQRQPVHKPLLISGSIIGGLGIVGIATGSIVAAKSAGYFSDYENAANAYNQNQTIENYNEVLRLEDQWLSTRTAAIVTMSVGGAMAITGAILIVAGIKKGRQPTAHTMMVPGALRVTF